MENNASFESAVDLINSFSLARFIPKIRLSTRQLLTALVLLQERKKPEVVVPLVDPAPNVRKQMTR